MSYGMQIYDQNGALKLDLSHKLGKTIYSTVTSSVGGLANLGTTWTSGNTTVTTIGVTTDSSTILFKAPLYAYMNGNVLTTVQLTDSYGTGLIIIPTLITVIGWA